MTRVVITGMGGVSPIGIGAEAIWESAVAGRSGIGPITYFDVSKQKCRIAGEVRGFEPAKYMPAKHLKRMDDFARYAVAASVMAVDDAKLEITPENSLRIGVLLGNNNGGARTIFKTVAGYLAEGPDSVSP
ncbi:MAG TPA: beta-ketoacyl synthase N-terminal-like domain-containing protein, partial [Candidatus Binatia bacterium]|nr:beta-ketoacyl synthase N-terminal-like domain-containing protein [Candidatus Binatia bacterium]